ncbi:hypothetical protein J4462_03940 [Candidatus Pacearchaeota archaeon]|nr:hypothetical protein [Candidatus Pacearchaeota archaeon]
MKTHKIGLVFGILFLFALSVVTAQQYGMMNDDGQFYQYGVMGDNNQFYPVNSGYGGMMGGGYGMIGMMNTMTGYGGYNAGAVLLSWITYLLTIALIIAGIYWLIKTANRKR